MNVIRGILTFTLIAFNTLVACIPLYLMGLARLLLRGDARRRLNRRMDWIIDYWVGCNRLLFQVLRLTRVNVRLEGDAELSRDQELTVHFRFTLTNAYFEDYLLVRTLSFGPAARDELYVVRPPYRLVDDSERARLGASVTPPEFSSRISVFYVHMPQAEPARQLYVLVHKARVGDSAICFEQCDGSLVMSVNPEVFAKIRAHMQSHRETHAQSAL